MTDLNTNLSMSHRLAVTFSDSYTKSRSDFVRTEQQALEVPAVELREDNKTLEPMNNL